MTISEFLEKYELYGKRIIFKVIHEHYKRYRTDKNVEDLYCYIEERRYLVKDNYKITLTPFNDLYWSRDYYIDDLLSDMKCGYVKMFIIEEL